MKNKLLSKSACLLACLLACFNAISQCAPGTSIINPVLTINNNRNCDVTVNYEVGDCTNSYPSGVNNYCNSLAQFVTTPYFVIPATSTFTVDISAQSSSGGNCLFYATTGLTFDVNVNLFEINYVAVSGGGIYGGVANGCIASGSNCFSAFQTDFGDTANPPAAPSSGPCITSNNAWSMQWQYLAATGVIVDIN